MAHEKRLEELVNYERSDLFTEREKVALRYADAITWDPSSADDAMWADLHKYFSDAELVELGNFAGWVGGGQRWIHTIGIGHGEVLFENTTGLSEKAIPRSASTSGNG